MKTRLIGLAGLAGSGKDTVAGMLGGQRFSFAEPLKRFCAEVFDFSDVQLNGPSAERNRPDTMYPREHGPWVPAPTPCAAACCSSVCACCGARTHETRPTAQPLRWPSRPTCHLTPRYALQHLGTEWGRDCFPDVWAALGVRRALAYLAENPGGLAVISDVRFTNEARLIREAGGEVWRVVRPGAGLAGGAGAHPSEAEQLGPEFRALIDEEVINTGTLELLAQEVRHLAYVRRVRL